MSSVKGSTFTDVILRIPATKTEPDVFRFIDETHELCRDEQKACTRDRLAIGVPEKYQWSEEKQLNETTSEACMMCGKAPEERLLCTLLCIC